MREIKSAFALAAVLIGSDVALAQDQIPEVCLNLGLSGLASQWIETGVTENTVVAFCSDYSALKREVNTLRDDMNIVRNSLPPDDAIILVDDGDKCPSGWRDMAEVEPVIFAGRVPLAATGGGPYRYRAIGGAPTHTLSPAEMPSHVHWYFHGEDNHPKTESGFMFGRSNHPNARFGYFASGSGAAQGAFHRADQKSQGANKAHNNMQPYVALYFCKKDAS